MPPSSSVQASNGDSSSAATSTVRRKGAPASNPKMEEFLRNWRQDALNKHQHDAAIFVGDKLLALTGIFRLSISSLVTVLTVH
jgi:hypothetical protein